jgi:cation-transporting ATPase E
LERYTTPDLNVGLTSDLVEKRKLQHLENKTNAKHGKTIGRIIFDNVFTFFNLLYLAITILLCVAQSWSNLTYLPVIIRTLSSALFKKSKQRR